MGNREEMLGLGGMWREIRVNEIARIYKNIVLTLWHEKQPKILI